jgi:hypothetical protein
MAISGPVAFNVVASAPEKNDAWLATGGSLYAVDLKTGKAHNGRQARGPLWLALRHRLARLITLQQTR